MLKETGIFDKGLPVMLKPFLAAACMSAVCIAISGPGVCGAEDFPPTATYLFFLNGERVGTSAVTFTTENDTHVFTSTSELEARDEKLSLSCRSEFDRATLRPLVFRFEGFHNRENRSGTITFGPDSVRAFLETSGHAVATQIKWVDGTAVFENFVPVHLAVLARRLAGSGNAFERFAMLFPSDMMLAQALATVDSEIELAAHPTPVVCRKYVVSLQNSGPLFLYVDTKRNLLVYIDFPATRTEVFLESVFGKRPSTRYKAPEEAEDEK